MKQSSKNISSVTNKLKRFGEDKINELVLKYEKEEFSYKSSSIRKMWRNWLRNDKELRDFNIVFEEKHQQYARKKQKQKDAFVPHQVGYIIADYDEPSYEVHLLGETKYKVSWLDSLSYDQKLAQMSEWVKKFCKTQSVKLVKSGTKNAFVIVTVFSG